MNLTTNCSDNFTEEYEKKLVSPDEAVKGINSGDVVDYGFFNGKPVIVDQALARRHEELIVLTVYCAVTVPPPPEVLKYPDSFIYNDWHWSKLTRMLQVNQNPYYSPILYERAPYYVRDLDIPKGYRSAAYDDPELKDNVKGVAICQTGPMDEKGFFNFGPQNSATSAFADEAGLVIIEVNSNQPRCLGGTEDSIHISRVDFIVEAPNNQMLYAAPPVEPGEIDKMIARNIMPYIKNGSCIQLGIGAMPNAVGKLIAESDLKNLGGHTEMLVDAFISMIQSGRMNGAKKNIDRHKCVYTFAVGSQKLYDFIDDNSYLSSYPVNYTNDPNVIGQIDDFVSINNAVQIDLFSQVNAESTVINGIPSQISGNGGMTDFIQGAYKSRNGKSFICLASTYKDSEGVIQSRIVPTLEAGTIVTIPRQMVDFVATEYGVERLTACPTWMRVEKLIKIAHPDFQDELIKEAEKMRIWRKSNKKF